MNIDVGFQLLLVGIGIMVGTICTMVGVSAVWAHDLQLECRRIYRWQPTEKELNANN